MVLLCIVVREPFKVEDLTDLSQVYTQNVLQRPYSSSEWLHALPFKLPASTSTRLDSVPLNIASVPTSGSLGSPASPLFIRLDQLRRVSERSLVVHSPIFKLCHPPLLFRVSTPRLGCLRIAF